MTLSGFMNMTWQIDLRGLNEKTILFHVMENKIWIRKRMRTVFEGSNFKILPIIYLSLFRLMGEVPTSWKI